MLNKCTSYNLVGSISCHSSFTRLIVCFHIGSNLVAYSYHSMSTQDHVVYNSAINHVSFISHQIYWPSIRPLCLLVGLFLSTLIQVFYLKYCSLQSLACLLFVHLNYNRYGSAPICNTNIYTCALGLTVCSSSCTTKRICDPTFNMIRGLFVVL